MTRKTVSVVIPTHNRRASVVRAVAALSGQSYPADALEVVVVADGCTDGTASIAAERSPIAVRMIEQPAQGPATARNRGAASASGDILIFLDDDIEVSPAFVDAHVRRHTEPDVVVVGYLPPMLQERRDFFAVVLRRWWEGMFEGMRDPGHRFAYSDLLSGNVSLPRALFARVGGFNETLLCHEDYELGFRLIEAGAQLRFAEDAAGWHHEHTDLPRALQRKRHEGRADITLARLHPALIPVLPFSRDERYLGRRGRAFRRLALTRPAVGDRLEAMCRAMLPALEALRRRTRWRHLVDDLLLYAYWRGVRETVDEATLAKVVSAPQPGTPAPCDLDLRLGLDAAVSRLDACRPEAVRLKWGPLIVATVQSQPGAERLQGRHLRSLLQRRFPVQFAKTLALAQLLGRSASD